MTRKKDYNSISIAKKFYISSINFFDACKILGDYVIGNTNPSIIYPLIYLERHALELLLKSLILSDIARQKISEKLEININGSKFELSRTHSLEILLDKYCLLQTQYRLVPMFDERINKYKSVIKKYDEYDRTSEFYRYPLTKTGKFTPSQLWKDSSDSILNEIGKNNGYLVFDFEAEPLYIKHVYNVDEKALFFKDKFYEIINYFMKLSPFSKLNQ